MPSPEKRRSPVNICVERGKGSVAAHVHEAIVILPFRLPVFVHPVVCIDSLYQYDIIIHRAPRSYLQKSRELGRRHSQEKRCKSASL